ncbi:MAG: PxxKW family cysteine-rich protein, partial [Pseudomonadota bacterium]
MICVTIRKDSECAFMTKKGCSFRDGSCLPVTEACTGCARILEKEGAKYCASYPDPAVKWKLGSCN